MVLKRGTLLIEDKLFFFVKEWGNFFFGQRMGYSSSPQIKVVSQKLGCDISFQK
jgi:hypothetical protein